MLLRHESRCMSRVTVTLRGRDVRRESQHPVPARPGPTRFICSYVSAKSKFSTVRAILDLEAER